MFDVDAEKVRTMIRTSIVLRRHPVRLRSAPMRNVLRMQSGCGLNADRTIDFYLILDVERGV